MVISVILNGILILILIGLGYPFYVTRQKYLGYVNNLARIKLNEEVYYLYDSVINKGSITSITYSEYKCKYVINDKISIDARLVAKNRDELVKLVELVLMDK